MKTFKDQVVLITGAGGGLGRSHALYLASLGAKILVNDLGGSVQGKGSGTHMADETVDMVRELGSEAIADYSSVESMQGAASMVEKAISHFGRLDAVLNNAGILRDASFSKQKDEDWNQVLSVHLNGSRNVTKAAWPHFCQRKYGRVLFTSSASGLYGNFGQSDYGAAKMGLIGLMNTLKEEGARFNIQVNAIAPLAKSRMTESVLPPDLLEKLDPKFISPVAAYLLSDSCKINGQCWAVGAGRVARVAVVESLGASFAENLNFGISEVEEKLLQITSLEAAKAPQNLMDALSSLFKN